MCCEVLTGKQYIRKGNTLYLSFQLRRLQGTQIGQVCLELRDPGPTYLTVEMVQLLNPTVGAVQAVTRRVHPLLFMTGQSLVFM